VAWRRVPILLEKNLFFERIRWNILSWTLTCWNVMKSVRSLLRIQLAERKSGALGIKHVCTCFFDLVKTTSSFHSLYWFWQIASSATSEPLQIFKSISAKNWDSSYEIILLTFHKRVQVFISEDTVSVILGFDGKAKVDYRWSRDDLVRSVVLNHALPWFETSTISGFVPSVSFLVWGNTHNMYHFIILKPSMHPVFKSHKRNQNISNTY